ncbi:MAG: response regulator transcription factor [Firmicutes bacterium]|nr:response regulator transcription factor [Bacillota bacterium]
MSRIKLMIVDHHPVIREGLVSMLNSYQDIDIVGICSGAVEALEFVDKNLTDVVLVNIKQGKTCGIETARKILAKTVGVKVIMLAPDESAESIRLSMQAGASGYMSLDVPKELLAESIRRVHNGETVIDPSLINLLVTDYVKMSNSSSIRPQNPVMPKNSKLTPRENEVLGHLAQGLTNSEISARTHLSVETVRTHLRHIYRKLGVVNRTQAILRMSGEINLKEYS